MKLNLPQDVCLGDGIVVKEYINNSCYVIENILGCQSQKANDKSVMSFRGYRFLLHLAGMKNRYL